MVRGSFFHLQNHFHMMLSLWPFALPYHILVCVCWKLVEWRKKMVAHNSSRSVQSCSVDGFSIRNQRRKIKYNKRCCWALFCGQFPYAVFFYNQIFQLFGANHKIDTYGMGLDFTRRTWSHHLTYRQHIVLYITDAVVESVQYSNYLYLICLSGIDFGHTHTHTGTDSHIQTSTCRVQQHFGVWAPMASGYFYSHRMALLLQSGAI